MDSVSGVGVIDKAALILRAAARPAARPGRAAGATGLPRATAHRLLVALEQHHLVRRDEQGGSASASSSSRSAASPPEQFGLGEVAMPAMQLRDTSGESVQLYVREDDGAAAASCRCSRRTRCAGSCPRAACCRSASGSAGRVLGGEPVGPGRVDRQRRGARGRASPR
jgi:DNA-binding IclR family transcriptional regulator